MSFTDILRAADDVGMLVAFSQPHFSHYDWKAADADRTNGYARHAEFYVRAAENHPSVVAYSMSHNATGYDEDMNPDQIDGLKDPHSDSWSQNNAKLALRAEAIVKKYDPGRIVYHHSSGNLGSMHTMNFYLNFVPSQELSDWFGHWAEKGVKPVFMCEYGVPFTWDWTMYRGWYKGQREWGSARFRGSIASPSGTPNSLATAPSGLASRRKRTSAGRRRSSATASYGIGGIIPMPWDRPFSTTRRRFSPNTQATTGVPSAPGESPPIRRGNTSLSGSCATAWSADAKSSRWTGTTCKNPDSARTTSAPRQGSMAMDGEREDWIPTAAGQALLRNNRPLLAYIGGKPDHFTSKDHLFRGGETVEKQLILINNSRETVSCDCEWSLGLPQPVAGSKKLTLPTGEQERIPLRFELPAALPAGAYELTAACCPLRQRRDAERRLHSPRPAAVRPSLSVNERSPSSTRKARRPSCSPP